MVEILGLLAKELILDICTVRHCKADPSLARSLLLRSWRTLADFHR